MNEPDDENVEFSSRLKNTESKVKKFRQTIFAWGREKSEMILDAILKTEEEFKSCSPSSCYFTKNIVWDYAREILLKKDFDVSTEDLKLAFRTMLSGVSVERSVFEIAYDIRENMARIVSPRLMSPIFVYKRIQMKRIIRENPELPLFVVGQRAFRMWHNLPEKERLKYQYKSYKINKTLKKRYPQLAVFQARRKYFPLSFNPTVPLPPPSLFAYFKSKQTSDRSETGMLKSVDFNEMWDVLSPEKLNKYRKKYKKKHKKFTKYFGSLPSFQREEVSVVFERGKKANKNRRNMIE